MKPDHVLDITAENCPMTFVRAKIQLEKMTAGQLLCIRLGGGEPLTNVPRAVLDHGHEIVAQGAVEGEADVHELWVRVAG